ncbi:MAG TPA: glutaredoxin family protein [Pirellulales bacterium]|jgi:glutaredoxin|nr:glutaredoxin family protein [Pirellulales bacterium]
MPLSPAAELGDEPHALDPRPVPRGMSRNTILYTRQGCHLCDVARGVLERHGLAPQAVDIDADPELQARFTNDVPVVVIDGVERFRGRVDEVLLRRLLAQRQH